MTKQEKIQRLIPVNYVISDEKLKEISKKWRHIGLDALLVLWHKYYNTTCHKLITHLLFKYREKQLRLEFAEECLKSIYDRENQ